MKKNSSGANKSRRNRRSLLIATTAVAALVGVVAVGAGLVTGTHRHSASGSQSQANGIVGQTTSGSDSWSASPSPTTGAPTTSGGPTGNCKVSALLVSSCGDWFGIAPQAFSGDSGPTALAFDENFTGSSFALAHEYKDNGTLFPTASDISIAEQTGHNRVLLENWKPATDETWAQTAGGAADARIDAEAAYLKSHFNLPFFLTIWHEPENDVIATAGSGMTLPDYQAMYRHVILRLRADGANKFVSVMNYMGFGKWNTMLAGLYPGDDVVDWIAYDPYQMSASGAAGHDFADMVNRTFQKSPGFYTWATTQHPSKPLMLAEWGGRYDPANAGGQAAFFNTVASQLGQFPALKAVVYFDADAKDVANGEGTTPNSGAASLAAWKKMVTSPQFATPSISYSNGEIVPTN